jgi:hypothetical protein
MGIAQAGIAFRITEPIDDPEALMSLVFNEPACEIASPVAARFDIRNHSDVMMQRFGDVCFVCNDDLAWPLLKDVHADARRLHSVLGHPDLLVAFCHYDLGGSHGYAIFEGGERTRTRLQTQGLPDVPALAQRGVPLPFERRWLEARHDVDTDPAGHPRATVYYLGKREVLVPARDLTGRMLQDGLEALFGVCPWESLLTPSYRFFRLGPPSPDAGALVAERPAGAAPGLPARRPWWRFR